MSKELIYLTAWISLTLVSILLGWLAFYLKNKRIKPLSLSEFMNISISSATIVSSINLLYKIITSKELQTLLQLDIYVLGLGILAVIWLSIQQIWTIFK